MKNNYMYIIKYILPLFLLLQSVSCKKDEISDAEKAEADSKIILEFMNTHKLVISTNPTSNHINWSVVKSNKADSTLINQTHIKDSVVLGNVVNYFYYFEIEKGKNIDSKEKVLIAIDFNEYNLNNTLISTSKNNAEASVLELKSRIDGVKRGLKYFVEGTLPEDNNEYRKATTSPGRGMLILPSSLTYKDRGSDSSSPNTPLRIDLVLYKYLDLPEEQKK